MKKNIFTYVLIIVTLISFMLVGCVSKSEKLNELEKNQQQMQKEMTTIEKAKQTQESVEKTTQEIEEIKKRDW